MLNDFYSTPPFDFQFFSSRKLIYVIMFRRGFYDSWKIFSTQLEC